MNSMIIPNVANVGSLASIYGWFSNVVNIYGFLTSQNRARFKQSARQYNALSSRLQDGIRETNKTKERRQVFRRTRRLGGVYCQRTVEDIISPALARADRARRAAAGGCCECDE